MSVSATVAASPFKGLVPYGDTDLDALFFFGRAREVEVITANLLASRLTVLYGPTGVGKSSVLRAGVVRSLRAVPFRRAVVVFDEWADEPAQRLVQMVADAAHVAPRASLTETLADAGAALDGELYLVLDQLEEYFVYHGGGLAPGSFTAELAEALTQRGVHANVLLCLREDALAKLDVLKTRVPALFSNYLRLDHLDRDAARTAIVGPVDRWNELFGAGGPISVEPALVEAVLDQVATGNPVGEGRGRVESADARRSRIEAPYLQLVLERLWEVERGQSSVALRLATLTALGGAPRIVGDHLLRAMRELRPDEKETAAALFRQMVTPSGTKIAHTVRDLARYASVPEDAVRGVVDRLVAERILRPVAGRTGDDPRFEIFHDVLAPAVLDWGTRFDAQRDEARARRAAELRHRRATVVAAVSLIALVVVAVIALFALTQRSQARARARSARANELAARALLLQATAPGEALADAVQASRLESNGQIESVLRSSLMASRLRRALIVGSPVQAVQWLGNGHLAVGAADGRVLVWQTNRDRVVRVFRAAGPVIVLARPRQGDRLLIVGGGAATMWNTETGRVVFTVRTDGRVADADISENGQVLATAGARGVAIRRATDGRLLRRIALVGSTHVAFAPDGRTIVVVRRGSGGDATASTYDVASGRLLAALPQPGIHDVAFAPDSKLLATASGGTVTLWRPRTGARLRVLDDGGKSIRDVAFNPRGTMLATASSDGGVRVWRIADGSRFFFFLGHSWAVTRVAFSPDGTYLASMSDDRTARIWVVEGIEAGKLAAVLAGSRGVVSFGAFSPGGHSLVTAGEDGTVRLWEPRVEQRLTTVATDPGRTDAVRLLPDGNLVSVAGGSVRTRAANGLETFPLRGRLFALWPGGRIASAVGRSIVVQGIPGGERLATLRAPATVTALAFRADAQQLVAAAGRTLVVWNTSDGSVVHRFQGEAGIVRVALAPRGDVVLTGDTTGVVRLWSPEGKTLHVLRRHHGAVTDARFDRSGALVVTASKGSVDNAAVWDARTGQLRLNLVGHFGTVTAASFSPDERWVLTAGPVSAAIWSAATGGLLFYLRGPTDLLTDAEWAPTGYRVATAERDGILREYTCVVCRPLDELRAVAVARLAAR